MSRTSGPESDSTQVPDERGGRVRAVLIWINFGPYHYARISALARRCRLTAIQLASYQRIYGWRADAADCEACVITVMDGVWEELSQIKVAAGLWRLLDKIRPEVLLIPAYDTAPAVAGAIWGRLHGSRTIVMAVSTQRDYKRERCKETVKSILLKVLFERAATTGTMAARYLRSLGFRKSRISVCGNVVDNDFFWRGVTRSRNGERPPTSELPEQYFLFTGRLAPEKNLGGLFRCFENYRLRGGKRDLVVVGDGPSRADLEATAESSRSRKHIHFVGHRDAHGLFAYYAFADCFILPSYREPWGLVVNEAMACGLPVIVSARCGCVEDLVVDGENGFVFDPQKEDELTERLHRIDSMSGEELTRMGLRSREMIADFSLENWAAKIQRAMGN